MENFWSYAGDYTYNGVFSSLLELSRVYYFCSLAMEIVLVKAININLSVLAVDCHPKIIIVLSIVQMNLFNPT